MTRWLQLATACCLNDQGELLVVRKRGTQAWMLPGGKIEPQETAVEALVREVQEELNWPLNPAQLQALATFEAPAANEADTFVRAQAFVVGSALPATLAPQAEIEAMQWLPLEGALANTLPPTLAPLLRHHILPALCAWRDAQALAC